MKFVFVFLSVLLSISCLAQEARDFMIGTHLDLIKSNNDGYFEKLQIGAEFNYFISKSFTGTAGAEFWTGDQVSGVIGGRWYPTPDAFIRLRGLIGKDDISIGGGWAKPVSEHWRIEAIADFYFEGNYAIRAGVAYLFRKEQ